MSILTCPKCGTRVKLVPVERLSPAARHVLEHAPRKFLSGQQLPLREIARVTGYSMGAIYVALRELADAGYVQRIPRGKRKHVYRGIPQSVS